MHVKILNNFSIILKYPGAMIRRLRYSDLSRSRFTLHEFREQLSSLRTHILVCSSFSRYGYRRIRRPHFVFSHTTKIQYVTFKSDIFDNSTIQHANMASITCELSVGVQAVRSFFGICLLTRPIFSFVHWIETAKCREENRSSNLSDIERFLKHVDESRNFWTSSDDNCKLWGEIFSFSIISTGH